MNLKDHTGCTATNRTYFTSTGNDSFQDRLGNVYFVVYSVLHVSC